VRLAAKKEAPNALAFGARMRVMREGGRGGHAPGGVVPVTTREDPIGRGP
jgi:hypothetical protein